MFGNGKRDDILILPDEVVGVELFKICLLLEGNGSNGGGGGG